MLRETLGSFGIMQLKLESAVDSHVSDNTIIRIIKRNKYHYLQSRKKGLMSRHDARTRLLFAQKVRPVPSRDFWSNGIGFYFDGASWNQKTNSSDLLHLYHGNNNKGMTTIKNSFNKSSDNCLFR